MTNHKYLTANSLQGQNAIDARKGNALLLTLRATFSKTRAGTRDTPLSRLLNVLTVNTFEAKLKKWFNCFSLSNNNSQQIQYSQKQVF